MKNQPPENVCVFPELACHRHRFTARLHFPSPLVRIKLDLKYVNENLFCGPQPLLCESQDRP